MLCRARLAHLVLLLAATSLLAQQEPQPPKQFPTSPASAAPPQAGTSQQSPEPATPTLKLSTRIVVLDVVVTDRKGNLVNNLTRDDFTIVEDKVPQTIRSFDPPASHVMPPGDIVHDAGDLKKIGDAPVTILVLDVLNTPFPEVAFSRQALVKFLQAQPPVLKQPTVLLMAGNFRFAQLHDYTQNRDALIDAVKHAPVELPIKQSAGRGGPAAVERMAQSLASLEQIAQASSGTPGRKNVIWVGDGFPSADIVGLDPKTADTILAAVKQCTDMLLAARVTMYTINPTLNGTSSIYAETPEDLTMAEDDNGGEPYSGSVQFSTFAPATGGRSFLSRNDVNNEIAEGIAAGASYYTLSYDPTNRTDDGAKYRHIRIVMKDPNLRATTRDGYYPPTAATTNIASTEPPKQAAAQLQLDISNAVNSALSYNGLDVKANRVGANYVIQVRNAGLDWHASATSGQEQAEETVFAAWFDAKGKLLGRTGRELIATRKTDDPGTGSANFVLPVPVPAGAARLRIIVRDAANGHIGTVDIKP